MKKMINNKRYDTDTAKKVAETNHGQYGNLDYWSEELFRKSTGEYFLHCEGGANSKYCKKIDANNWSAGECIKPLTYQEAQQWAEQNMDGDEYEKEFGEIDESTEIVKQTISMRADKLEAIKRAAAKNEMKISEYIVKRCLDG